MPDANAANASLEDFRVATLVAWPRHDDTWHAYEAADEQSWVLAGIGDDGDGNDEPGERAMWRKMMSRSCKGQDASSYGGNREKAGHATLAEDTYSPCQPDANSRAGPRKRDPTSNELECEGHINSQNVDEAQCQSRKAQENMPSALHSTWVTKRAPGSMKDPSTHEICLRAGHAGLLAQEQLQNPHVHPISASRNRRLRIRHRTGASGLEYRNAGCAVLCKPVLCDEL